MDAEGRDFLMNACEPAKTWAMRYETLADAWDACGNPAWMAWALDQKGVSLGLERGTASAKAVREYVGNPFRPERRCFFCDSWAAPLTDAEIRDSHIVGLLLRCRERLKLVGLDVAA